MKNRLCIDRSSKVPLVDQATAALKAAIVAADFKPGDVLPGIRELAERLSVSEKVSRLALRRLADDGWVTTRRHVGSVVSERGLPPRAKGRILFFDTMASFGYHDSRFISALRRRLIQAGYRLSSVMTSGRMETKSYAQLAELLHERWDLVLEYGMDQRSRQLIEKAGWPFLIVGNGVRCVSSDAANSIGCVNIRSGLALPDFVHECVRRNVRSVWQFVGKEAAFDATEMLRIAGIRATTFSVAGWCDLEGLVKRSYEVVSRLLQKGRRRLPDVLLFTDDYIARGGLMAVAIGGIRVPEDVSVVSHSNRGLGLVWPVPVTRLEMDASAQGRVVADEILSFFRQKRAKGIDMTLGSVWKRGGTF